MDECCGGKKQDCCESRSSECCSDGKTVLFYACSGGANVGEVADRACRELMYAGCGTMFCLAGLGCNIEGMIQTARDADMNIVIGQRRQLHAVPGDGPRH